MLIFLSKSSLQAGSQKQSVGELKHPRVSRPNRGQFVTNEKAGEVARKMSDAGKSEKLGSLCNDEQITRSKTWQRPPGNPWL